MESGSLVCRLALGLVTLSGCVATVDVTFDACTYEGESLGPGESVKLEDGCTICTCSSADGLVACSSAGCTCAGPDGTILQDGEGWSDLCQDCVCSAGVLQCTGVDCGCGSAPPLCEPPGPGCSSTPICDGFEWYCETFCDPCSARTMPICPVGPPECWGGGAVCDPTFGWFCEEPICPCQNSTTPECFPFYEGCESYPECDVTFDEYYCQEVCACDLQLPPYCGPFGQVACDVDALEWTCTSLSNTCGPDIPTCGTMTMGCTGFPLCQPDGTWVCAEECTECDPMEMPPCPAEQPNCAAYTYCGPSGAVCELICF
jgi:hypothetical protein